MSDPNSIKKDIPEHLHDLFWEYDISDLTWNQYGDFIIRRVLTHGNWEQICWVRDEFGDSEVGRVIKENEGRSLSRRQLRFWQLILDLPAADVERWLGDCRRQVWDRRV